MEKAISKEQISLISMLAKTKVECGITITVWFPTKEQLNLILASNLKVSIHPDSPTILRLYEGRADYDAYTKLVIYFKDADMDNVREHPKLKDLYNEWFFKKQKEAKKGGEQINEGKRKSR